MATVTVWKFSVSGRAAEAVAALNILAKRDAIHLIDGAWVTWASDAEVPEPHRMHDTGDEAAFGADFWDHLFKVIFPMDGGGAGGGKKAAAQDAAIVAAGIDDEFVDHVRSQVTHGTSAIFLVSEGADMNDVKEALAHHRPRLIASNLPSGLEWRLRKAMEE